MRSRSPVVGRYVQSLFVRSWFFDLLHKRDKMLKPSVQGINSMMNNIIDLFQKRSPPSQPQAPSPQYVGFEASHKAGILSEGVPTKVLVGMLINAVQWMVNVTVFDFEWRDLSLNPQTVPFFTSMQTAFDSSLRKLVLKAQISKFKELLALANFRNIDQLDLTFDYQTIDKAKDVQYVLCDTIVPFIEQRRTCLRSLAITSWAAIDLSAFFARLPVMPGLRQLSIHISFHEKVLSDTSSILSVLLNAKFTLLYVSFRITDSPLAMSQNWHRLNDGLLAHRDCLRNLETLQIPFSSTISTGPIISRSSETLTRLSLTNKYLSNHEISQVADVFEQRPFQLRHLHIGAHMVDYALIRLLSRKFLGLTSLIIVYERLGGVEYSYEDAVSDSLLSLVNHSDPGTQDVIERTALADWKLTELEVHYRRHQSYNIDNYEDGRIATTFCIACIPSLQRVNRRTVK